MALCSTIDMAASGGKAFNPSGQRTALHCASSKYSLSESNSSQPSSSLTELHSACGGQGGHSLTWHPVRKAPQHSPSLASVWTAVGPAAVPSKARAVQVVTAYRFCIAQNPPCFDGDLLQDFPEHGSRWDGQRTAGQHGHQQPSAHTPGWLQAHCMLANMLWWTSPWP